MRIQRWTSWGVGTMLAAALCLGAANTAIVEAAKNRDKAALKTLLAHKADARTVEPDGTTALHWAAHWADMEMVDMLLKAGADVKAENRYGVTPLAELVTDGGAALIERLLKAGADPNTLTSPEGETVLMTASRLGNTEAVKVLLDHGADPNTK